LKVFEDFPAIFSYSIEPQLLAMAILDGYSTVARGFSSDELLWLLAHFIGISNAALTSAHKLAYLEALQAQLSALSTEIIVRLGERSTSDLSSGEAEEDSHISSTDQYISEQLYSLVSKENISTLLRDLFESLSSTSSQELSGPSLLAGYIFTVLLCFPSKADDIRMRLFLEAKSTPDGEIPTVQILWKTMRASSLFRKLSTESEPPLETLRNYVRGSFNPFHSTLEEQEWRVVLMFLELYIFILRLSDDEDFFSGIQPSILDINRSTSRIRACSLSLEDLTVLTRFLKNTAFTLHYHAREIYQAKTELESSTSHGLGLLTTIGSAAAATAKKVNDKSAVETVSTKLDINTLKEIITTALKMLYERDSRKQFLPLGHWLMTEKLDRQDFISAVIAEDERKTQEDDNDTDDEEEQLNEHSSMVRPTASSIFNSRTRVSHTFRIERMRLFQKRAQKERRMAEMGPKLEILKHMPFVVPFETRVKIFRQFISLDRDKRSPLSDPFGGHAFARHHAEIRRGSLFHDAYENFYKLGEGLKDPISITFVDQFNTREAGIDGGGVTKEFLTSVTTEAFGTANDDMGMFTSSDKGLLYPNPIVVDHLREALRRQGLTDEDWEWRDAITQLQRKFDFLGRIVGKCLYEGILVDLAFAGFFLLQWPSAGSKTGNTYKGSVNDLRDMDEELYKGMLRLKNYQGDISELGIDFTITDQVSAPNEPIKTITRNLIPNGDQVLVTNDNRLLYISYVARHRLMVQPAMQTSAFLNGLRTIIHPSWLSMFNQSELQRLVGGDSSEIDIEDLRSNTVYSGLYEIGDDGEEHGTIKLFWKVMKSFTDAQRRDVVKYVSSTPRAPLLGFSQLRPKFSIRDGGSDQTRLPSTSTCVNLLKLPMYRSEAVMREKLLYAITSGAGFDLS
jgi:ubiquitin-protein ligase E3 C